MRFVFVAKVNKLYGLKNLRFIYLCLGEKKLILHETNKIFVMKKYLLFGFVMVSAVVFGQKGAKIVFLAADNTIDYGSVYKESDNGTRIFEFTNTGNAPLLILNVSSTCGCTVPSKPKTPILPGKNGKITVKYNMNPGAIRKTIIVESNAVNVPEGKVILKIKGEVLVKEINNPMEKKKSMMSN